jgi:hypothetical protein
MITKTKKSEAMYAMIESWKASGQSQQEFCKAQGISYFIFHYWYKKYREHKSGDGLSAFVPVHIQKTSAGLPHIELIFPDGKRINFYDRVEVSFLQSLLA